MLTLAGTMVFQNTTLGGRLHHTHNSKEEKAANEDESEKSFKTGASVSLGIASAIEVDGKYSYGSKNFKKDGTVTSKATDTLVWTGIGGNPSLTIE